MGSLQAIVEGERPTWTPLDTIVSVTIVGIVLLFTGLCCIAIIRARRKKKERYLAKRDEESFLNLYPIKPVPLGNILIISTRDRMDDAEKLNELKKKLKRYRKQAYENKLVKKRTLKEKRKAEQKHKNKTKEDFEQAIIEKKTATNNNAPSCEEQKEICCIKIIIRKPESNETKSNQKLKTTKNGIDKATFQNNNKVDKSFKIKLNKKEQRRSKVQQKSVSKKKTNSEQTTNQRREDLRKRVAKYRSKMTEEQLIEKRRKDRERYKLKKEKGLTPDINKMSTKKKKQIRKKWREASSSYRKRERLQQKTENFLGENSPPISDIEVESNQDDAVVNDNLPKHANETSDVATIEEKKSDQKSTGRK
ncbi:unnamed protein product, partial [Callosobruchus maculatus]